PLILGKTEYKIYPLDIIILGIILGLIISFLKKSSRKKIEVKKADKILFGFIFLNVAYYFLSIYYFNSNSYLSFSSLKNYAFYSLLYFLTYLSVENKEQIKRLLKFYFSGTIFILGFIAFGIINGTGPWTEYTPLSTEGARILAFTHGLYLALALIPLTLLMAFKKNEKLNKFLISLILIFSAGILGTMMRHIWVALALAFCLIYFMLQAEQKKEIKNILFKTILPITLFILLFFYSSLMLPQSKLSKSFENIQEAISQRSVSIIRANKDESFVWRKIVWESAWKEYQQNMFFGIGTGQKVSVENGGYRDFVEVRNMHNSYLTILAQFGILGSGLFLYFIFTLLKNLIKSGNIKTDFYKMSFLSVLAVYSVAFVFQPYLETNLLAVFFWINLGLIRIVSDQNYENS
ncbi:MAG TPA: hypothetical protein DCS28_03270, partial [Candidatus Moranbacteria bacterium]|nr:hypothetical protein [Candidatus Moranbacteria bacterium]